MGTEKLKFKIIEKLDRVTVSVLHDIIKNICQEEIKVVDSKDNSNLKGAIGVELNIEDQVVLFLIKDKDTFGAEKWSLVEDLRRFSEIGCGNFEIIVHSFDQKKDIGTIQGVGKFIRSKGEEEKILVYG
jgi:hypothetical protein